jgi:hypothetical protein
LKAYAFSVYEIQAKMIISVFKQLIGMDALATLDDPTLPPVEKIVLISPAMGVSRLAVLFVW